MNPETYDRHTQLPDEIDPLIISFPAERIAPKPERPPAQAAMATLREIYEEWIVPEKIDRAAHTMELYRTALSHWSRQGNGEMPIARITDRTLLEFRNSLFTSGMAAPTVNKTLRHLMPMIRRCGPRDSRNRQGLGLIGQVPWVETLAEDISRPRVCKVGEIGAWYTACDAAIWPKQKLGGPNPVLWWRTAIVLFWHYGMRTIDLLSLQRCDIDWERDLLIFVPIKTKRRKPEPLELPLCDVTRAHLQAINKTYGRRTDTTRLLSAAKSNKCLHRQRTELQEAAKIANPYTFSDLRKTCNTQLNRVMPGIGKWFLGHAPRDVNSLHYTNPETQMREAVEKLPVPDCFRNNPIA